MIDGVSIPLSILPDGTLADKNNDRLPDEVARLLNEGTLLYDNTALLIGVTDMYGDSDDWDGDGLKNGEEIESAVSLTGNLKILIHSNPLIADSDGDGVNDYREVKELGTSPMRTNRTPVAAKNSLMSNGKYSYEISKQAWENDVALFLDWNKQEKAKQLLINYLYDYAPQDTAVNAEAISRLQEYEDCINYVVLVSNLMKIGKNAVDLYGNVSDLSKTRNITIYTDGKDLKKDMLDAINKKDFDAAKDAWSAMDLSSKVEQISIDLENDDLFKSVKDAANLSSAAAKAVKLYRSSKTAYDMSFVNSYTVYYNAAKGSALKTAKTTLSVAIDVLDYVESYNQIQSTYGKIKANMEAYQRYYDMLIYIKLNAQDAFVRNAAGDLANMVLDTEGEYMKQVSAACAKEQQWATLNVALDLTNKNPYVAIFQTFITLVPITGVNEMVDSTITCRTMKAVSDACAAEISCLVKDEGADSFSYLPSKSSAVYDNLVQLAQSRIMGEYYLYEYCAEDSSMASKINQFIGAVTGGNSSPEKYREIGKKKIKGIYDDANKLNLKLSPNLPYYSDFYKALYKDEGGESTDNVEEGHWHDDPTNSSSEVIGVENPSSNDQGVIEDRIPYTTIVRIPEEEFDLIPVTADMVENVNILIEQMIKVADDSGLKYHYPGSIVNGEMYIGDFETPNDDTTFYAGTIIVDSPKGLVAFRAQGQVFPEEHAYKYGYLTAPVEEIELEYDEFGSVMSCGYPSFWTIPVDGINEIQNTLSNLRK